MCSSVIGTTGGPRGYLMIGATDKPRSWLEMLRRVVATRCLAMSCSDWSVGYVSSMEMRILGQ